MNLYLHRPGNPDPQGRSPQRHSDQRGYNRNDQPSINNNNGDDKNSYRWRTSDPAQDGGYQGQRSNAGLPRVTLGGGGGQSDDQQQYRQLDRYLTVEIRKSSVVA